MWLFWPYRHHSRISGIPPTVVDSSDFKQYTSTLNSAYKLPSSTTLSQKLIPEEATKILRGMIEFLKACRNCTISFDGGKTRKPKGLYTIHLTTTDRHSFCVETDDSSCLSHTTNYVFGVLARVSLTLPVFVPSNSHHYAFDRTWSRLAHLDSLECAQTTQEIQGKDGDSRSPSGPKIWNYWTHTIYSQILGRIYVVFLNSKRSVICI